MRYFLAGFERVSKEALVWKAQGLPIKNVLMTFWAMRSYGEKSMSAVMEVRDGCEHMLVDSGAHTFQHGKARGVASVEEYVEEYARFIEEFDSPNVDGFFELDIDSLIGIDAVLQIRERLERVSDKIIPVWHDSQGIDEFRRLCEHRKGRTIAISGFQGRDIRASDLGKFVEYAHRKKCKIHGLGAVKRKILEKVHFDSVDSAAWIIDVGYGKVRAGQYINKATSKLTGYRDLRKAAYTNAVHEQCYYEQLWRCSE